MEKFNPKLEIVNHFDNLIHRIDIEFEESLEKYKEDQVLSGFKVKDEKNFKDESKFKIDCHEFSKSSSLKKRQRTESQSQYSESTKVVDYLSQLRMKAIDELKNAQEESLEQYSLNPPDFDFNNSEFTNQDKISLLFPHKFHFQVKLSKPKWIFNLFTFVTDFFLSNLDIDLLQ